MENSWQCVCTTGWMEECRWTAFFYRFFHKLSYSTVNEEDNWANAGWKNMSGKCGLHSVYRATRNAYVRKIQNRALLCVQATELMLS